MSDTKLFLISHKKLISNLYKDRKIIYVGPNSSKLKEEDDLVDNVGDNIGDLNYTYCELTGIYYIYKNIQADIIGVEHYRRIFKSAFFQIRKKKYFEKKLKKYDIILPIRYWMGVLTVKKHMIKHHGKYSYILLEEAIKTVKPDYLESFYEVMEWHSLSFFNMLVTSKKNFDEFCNFIFPVLNYVYQKALTIDDKKELDINRYIGFLAERLVNIFVKKNNLKAKQSFVCFDFKYKKSSKLNKKPAKSA